MAFDESQYRRGYSVGVGGVVLCEDKVLLVQRALGERRGDWAIPGGFVERGETADVAARREVLEEAGVVAEVEGLMAARSRVIGSGVENSAYLVFLLRASSQQAQPDEFEVTAARFFTLDEVQVLSPLQGLSRIVVTRALQGRVRVLKLLPHPKFSLDDYILYV
jgi:8-oxo-dGTP diphosphatase